MKKDVARIAAACLIITVIGIFAKSSLKCPTYVFASPVSRYIQYSFTLRNKSDRVVKNAELWACAPVSQTRTQICSRLQTSYPHKLIKDIMGNQILYFKFDLIPPYAARIINIKAELLLSNTSNQTPVGNISVFLGAEKYCEINAPEIIQLAKKLKTPETAKTAGKIFYWIKANIKYAGYQRNARGALATLKSKKGDCTELMYLFAALCRVNGIPVRCMGGYICKGNMILKPNRYHNWSEYYEKGRWRLIDFQSKRFQQNSVNHIAMKIITESTAENLLCFERYRCKGEGLKIKMNF